MPEPYPFFDAEAPSAPPPRFEIENELLDDLRDTVDPAVWFDSAAATASIQYEILSLSDKRADVGELRALPSGVLQRQIVQNDTMIRSSGPLDSDFSGSEVLRTLRQ